MGIQGLVFPQNRSPFCASLHDEDCRPWGSVTRLRVLGTTKYDGDATLRYLLQTTLEAQTGHTMTTAFL